ncbi:MAG: hypothetical protein HOP91_08480 [Sphingomonas sp.]|nr:hypothetical protein [Sphingomonas sp.]
MTRSQREQNRAFLKALRRTGNIRLAAQEVGLKYGTVQHRRRAHPAFAQQCATALAFAQARLNGGGRKPLSPTPRPLRGEGHRTVGGEPHLVRLRDGTIQMKRSVAGRLTCGAEQAFLLALSATCNVSLAAAAVGASPRAFYRRKKQCPAFAREMRMALQRGYDALELALTESMLASAHEHDDWRHNDPPAIPPMTTAQALQLLYLHQKEARLTAEPDYLKRRRGESHAAHSERVIRMAEERDRRAREEFEVAEAERWERGEPPFGPAGEEVRRKLGLPDLAQVTGWSRADPAKEPHGDSALFGGWRIEDMEAKRERDDWDWSER